MISIGVGSRAWNYSLEFSILFTVEVSALLWDVNPKTAMPAY